MEHPWWLKPGFVLLAGIGGFLGHIHSRYEVGEKVSWGRAIVEGAASSFVGFLVMLLCLSMKLSVEWTGFIVGVCGWLGAKVTIQLLEKVVSNKIGANKNDR